VDWSVSEWAEWSGGGVGVRVGVRSSCKCTWTECEAADCLRIEVVKEHGGTCLRSAAHPADTFLPWQHTTARLSKQDIHKMMSACPRTPL
jgi:hypothetical protein